MFVVCLGEYGTSFGIDKHPSCKVKNLVSHVMCDKVSFDQGECSCTLHFKNADGAWQLLQHFVCRDYKTSQRGNGAGGVHSRHNAHRLYPSHQPVKSGAKPKKCEDKVTVRMVSPAQATVEQARSEAKQLKEQERSHQSAKKRRSIQTLAKPRKKSKYSGTNFEDGSRHS